MFGWIADLGAPLRKISVEVQDFDMSALLLKSYLNGYVISPHDLNQDAILEDRTPSGWIHISRFIPGCKDVASLAAQLPVPRIPSLQTVHIRHRITGRDFGLADAPTDLRRPAHHSRG